MSRTKRKPKLELGRDSFHVLTETGEQLSVKGEAPHALVVAQGAAERSPEEVTLTVSRQSLFGPAVTIFRVVRTADGTVYTATPNPED